MTDVWKSLAYAHSRLDGDPKSKTYILYLRTKPNDRLAQKDPVQARGIELMCRDIRTSIGKRAEMVSEIVKHGCVHELFSVLCKAGDSLTNEDIFHRCNVWSENGEMVDLIVCTDGVHHTSMSTGDIIVRDGSVWVCCFDSFQNVGPLFAQRDLDMLNEYDGKITAGL